MSKETFIDKALEHLRAYDPNHPSNRGIHRLLIESLRDGRAQCSCGGWYFSQTGAVVYEEVFEEFEKHLESTKTGTGADILRHSTSNS